MSAVLSRPMPHRETSLPRTVRFGIETFVVYDGSIRCRVEVLPAA